MIEKKCFTREWLESFKKQKEHKSIQTNILEKMIHALHLLELLIIHKLDFVFKGGTSLVLLLNEGNRFSIDIDIICNVEREMLERTLNRIVEKSKFTSVMLDEKRSYKEGVPKAHYAFEFESVFNTKTQGKILLDILIEDSIYPEFIESPIKTKWIETNETVLVNTPSIDAITGDKLTAFAPNTIGIPYFKGEHGFAMEICKQLFDLSKLFYRISNMVIVYTSFQAFAKKEISYRNHRKDFSKRKVTPDIVLQDTIDTCLTITKREANLEEPFKSNFKQLQLGIKAFGTGYLMTGNFRIEEAIAAAAEVAYIATKILMKDLSPITYYSGEDIKSMAIEHADWNFLNRLKRYPDKSSFYYWYHTVQLLTKSNSALSSHSSANNAFGH